MFERFAQSDFVGAGVGAEVGAEVDLESHNKNQCLTISVGSFGLLPQRNLGSLEPPMAPTGTLDVKGAAASLSACLVQAAPTPT